MMDDLRLQKTIFTARKSDPQPAVSNQKSIWRSLEELSGSKNFQKSLHREFPPNASEFGNFNRRNFLKILGATVALAGLPACTKQPLQKLVPYVNQPEELIPGKPMYFATAMTLGGFATGLIAESHEGHPTKLEGNPGHPSSLGATNVFHQAAILDLYDPDRSQAVLKDGSPSTWEEFVGAIHDALQSQESKDGSGLRILTETVTSPTLHSQIQQLLKKFPKAKWHQFEPVNRDNVREGAKLAFGESVEAHYHFAKAKIILSLDSDFLYLHPDAVRYAHDFAENRRARFPENEMNRLYAVESTPTVTGANADHHLPISSAEIEDFALALAEKLGAVPRSEIGNRKSKTENWISAIADDLSQNHGASIVIVGENQPPRVHALAHLLNHALGNIGKTVTFTESAQANWVNQIESLRELVNDLQQNAVDVLVMLGGNPVFTAPADFHFAENLRKAKFTVHQALHVNETSEICGWHVPENHFLESWSDARAFDGTVSIVQPLILPLYAGKSAHEILDAMLSPPGDDDYEIVRKFWKSQNAGDGFDGSWHQALHDGLVQKSALPKKGVSLKQFSVKPENQNSKPGLEITFRPDPTIYDGRFMNNGWLQELPKPINQLTWDNAAFVSPAFAQKENLSNGDVVEIEFQDRKLQIAIWNTPGQAENSIALPFGYGRKSIGRVGVGAGFNVYELRPSDALWGGSGAKLKKTGRTYQLVTTQIHHVIDSDERQIIREGTFDHFQKERDFVAKDSTSPIESDTLYEPKEFTYDGYKWGMTIDLSACIGCNACTIACQAENNIPVIGKEQVAIGRIMHWIRVDNYFRGAPDNPQMTFQPVPCMHCENAPCEVVCPVDATMTDSEGLNVQVYNRCIGTRYCSNNCPWKVRRFNFLQYAPYGVESFRPMWNPDVTVRWRGVMEKCTYCLQRISEVRITAENQNRRIREGEFQTACQQVCPTNAIVFGDLNAPDSRVAKMKTHDLNYLMLGQLNTRPRTSYLAKLRNPNPKLS